MRSLAQLFRILGGLAIISGAVILIATFAPIVVNEISYRIRPKDNIEISISKNSILSLKTGRFPYNYFNISSSCFGPTTAQPAVSDDEAK